MTVKNEKELQKDTTNYPHHSEPAASLASQSSSLLTDILDAAKVVESGSSLGGASGLDSGLEGKGGLKDVSDAGALCLTTEDGHRTDDAPNVKDDFNFLKPDGLLMMEKSNRRSYASKDSSLDERIAEAVKEAFQAGFAAAAAAAATATASASSGTLPASSQNLLSIITDSAGNPNSTNNNVAHADYHHLYLRSLHSSSSSSLSAQVPSPWLHGVETPVMGTPLSAFGINSLHGTPSGTPMGTPHSLAHTPWESPFMGSPFLSPFENPIGEMDAFESISHNHLDPSEKQVGNITSWWAENTEGVVDPKSFNELLVDTGFGMDLGLNENNDSLMTTSQVVSHVNTNEMQDFANETEIPQQPKKKQKAASSFTSKRTATKRPAAVEEDGMPSGAFWKVIKKDNKQTLFQCPFPDCNKTFTRPYNLKSHYRSHTGERPFVCEFEGCNLKFSRKYDLKRHEKIHSGLKSVECTDCGKTFIRTDYLRRHQRVQDGKTESECQVMRKLATRCESDVDQGLDVDIDGTV